MTTPHAYFNLQPLPLLLDSKIALIPKMIILLTENVNIVNAK